LPLDKILRIIDTIFKEKSQEINIKGVKMPLYEYRCNKCGKRFEKLVPTSEADKKQECPYCSSKDTEKLLSVFAAKFSSSPSAGISGGGGST